jgi:hypothetical protein
MFGTFTAATANSQQFLITSITAGIANLNIFHEEVAWRSISVLLCIWILGSTRDSFISVQSTGTIF